MIELAAWIRENYGSTMIQALKTVLPVQEKVARKARKYIELCIEKVHGPAMLDEYFSKHYVAKARLLAALLDHGKISWEMASKDLKISKSTVDSMEREGILHVVTEYYYRNPGEFSIAKAGAHVLNEQQQELIDEFREDFLREDHKTYLLHGITGSGKTEVYLAAIEEVIKQGKQAKRQIEWRNVAGYSTETVAQHTFALLFYLLEKLNYYDQYVKSEKYIGDTIFTHFSNVFHDLNGMTWGIVGLGNIGRRVADIAKMFGCHVIYYSTSGKNNQEGYERVDFDTLLTTSDIVSVHAPLDANTQNLMNAEAFAKMKKSAIFLNLGRGPIVVEQDLADALKNNEIAAAGLDVLCVEPMSADNPLREIKDSNKLIITPHIAWASVEARTRLMNIILGQVKEYFKL